MEKRTLVANITAVAKTAKLFGLPTVIATVNVATGRNQPTIHQIAEVFPDIVWHYPEPIAECPKIKGHLCFFNELVDEIRVDGVAVPKPITPWSKDWKEKSATVPDTRGPVTWP